MAKPNLAPVASGDARPAPEIAVIDAGYGAFKVLASGMDPIMFPSGAAPARYVPAGLTAHAKPPLVVDGQDFYAGFEQAGAPGWPKLLDDTYTASPGYYALMLEAFDRIGKPAIDLLVVGLPSRLYDQPPVVAALKQRLAGEHHCRGKTVIVQKVTVVDQPTGSVSYHYRANAASLARSQVMVIDIGHGTTDLTIVNRGAVDRRLSTSFEEAMSVVLDAASRRIFAEHGITLTREALEEACNLEDFEITMQGKPLDLRPPIQAEADAMAERLQIRIRAHLRSLTGYDQVLATGGGAYFLHAPLARLLTPLPVAMVDAPRWANGRGFRMIAEQLLGLAAEDAR